MGTGEPPGLLAHEDPAGRALALDACGGVDGVADHVGVVVGDDDLTGVDADPKADRGAVDVADALGDFGELGLQLETGPYRPVGVVLGHIGDPEHGHHAVADELHQRAVVAVDHPLGELVIARHLGAGRLGVDLLAERGRPDEVGEHHRHGLADGIVVGRFGFRPSGGAGADGRTALVTELGVRAEIGLAGGASGLKRGAARRAEPGCLPVRLTTRSARHRLPPGARAPAAHRDPIVPRCGGKGQRASVTSRT